MPAFPVEWCVISDVIVLAPFSIGTNRCANAKAAAVPKPALIRSRRVICGPESGDVMDVLYPIISIIANIFAARFLVDAFDSDPIGVTHLTYLTFRVYLLF